MSGPAACHGYCAHPDGPVSDPPGAFLRHVRRVLVSTRRMGHNEDTQHATSRDMWCEGGSLYAWARRYGEGGIVELFTTMVNRTGPMRRSAFSP